MDLLVTAAIEFPCDVCGGRRAVTLRQILLAQTMLDHEGCAASHGEGECPPAVFAPLVQHDLLEALERDWQRLDDQARAAGGRLVIGEEHIRQPAVGRRMS